jgi:hypothetical protein
VAAHAAEPPAPGSKIGKANLEAYRQYLTPGIERLLSLGLEIEVGRHKVEGLPLTLVEATRKHGSSVTYNPDTRYIGGYIAGLPFPDVPDDDPHVAIKRVFNHEAATAFDDLQVNDIVCDTGKIEPGSLTLRIEKSLRIDVAMLLLFSGRTVAMPIPTLEPNRDELRHKLRIGPVLEPWDLRGITSLEFRYMDRMRHDDTWLYVPQLRRVKRLSSAERGKPILDQDLDFDSIAGFSGNVVVNDWRHLGEKTVLMPFHAATFPITWNKTAGTVLPSGRWEPRRVWVLEAVSRLPAYPSSRRIVYLDRETYQSPCLELYGPDGQLERVVLNSFRFLDAPGTGAGPGSTYGHAAAISVADLGRLHATRCALPSTPADEARGWRFNLGENGGPTDGCFQTASLVPVESDCPYQ